VVLAVAVGFTAGLAKAGLIYTWDGDTDLTWETAANWAVGDPPADPTYPPGSNINGSGGATTDDVVNMPNPAESSKTVTIAGADVGTIDSLHIGGGSAAMTLELATDNGALTVTNDVTLGGVDPDDPTKQKAGNLKLSKNKNTSVTIGGDIVSGGTADNDLIIDTSGTFTLGGDIDAVGTHEIDFKLNRGTFTWNGTGMYVEEFDLVDSGTTMSNSITLGPGQTLVASGRSDIGRNSGAANRNRTTTGTLNIYGGTATFNKGSDTLVLGNVANDANSGKTHTANGTVNVGDDTNAGTLNVNGELRLAPVQDDTKDGAQVSTGTLYVKNAGSVVTITGGIEMAANGDEVNAGTKAEVTIDDGLVTVYGHIEDGVNASEINLNGGTLHLASAGAIDKGRGVDNFNMEDGATLKMTMSGNVLPLTAPAMDLDVSSGAGNANLDLRNAPADSAVDNTTSVEWDGGTANWDATATNWNPDTLPSQAAAPLVNATTYDVLDGSGNNITNLANIALSGAEAANWTLVTTDPTKLQATYVGTTTGFGPVKATISDAADVVTRTTDLKVANLAGAGADASSLDLSGGASLTLDDPADVDEPDLIIDGDSSTEPAEFLVTVDGATTTLDIKGNLIFGGAVGTQGGNFVMTGGVVTVAGDVVEGLADGTVDYKNVGTSQFWIDADLDNAFGGGDEGSLAVGGTINVHSMRIAGTTDAVASYTLPNGKTINNNGWMRIAKADSDVGTTKGKLVNDGGTITNNNFRLAEGAGSIAEYIQNSGTLDMRTPDGTGTAGDLFFGVGTGTATIKDGTVYVADLLQMSNDAAATATLTIEDGIVYVRNDIDYRADGTDTINLKGGSLIFGNPGGAIFAENPGNKCIIDADTTGTNAFNWTGGTISGLDRYEGSLTQDNTDNPSTLEIGSSPGQLDVTGDYILSGGVVEIELLVDPATGTKGVDWDLLNVTGDAAFNSDGQIALDLGTYTAQLNDEWDIVDAATIATDYADITNLFDTTLAGLTGDLAWDFGNFTTDGTVKVIPEPATLALLGVGAAAMVVASRRRRHG